MSEDGVRKLIEYARSGGNNKPVICLNDGFDFPSVKAAAEYYGIAATGISASANGKEISRRGLYFAFSTEVLSPDERERIITERKGRKSILLKEMHARKTPASYLKGKVEIELPILGMPEIMPEPIYVEGEVEQWRPVVGFEDFYEISDYGDVRSCTREVRHSDGGMMRRRGRPLKPRAMSGDRMFVTLYRGRGRKDIGVAVLVATAFVGTPEDGQIVLRRDTDPQNDRASNLFWGTMKDLAAKRSRDGTSLRGERHPLTNLTPEAVREIRALRGKKKQHEIGAMFGVSNSVVSGIQNGRTWSHVR
jgi:hypothetical protein